MPNQKIEADQANGIGWAVKQLQDRFTVRRRGWNGKGMWLGLRLPDESRGRAPYVYLYTGPTDNRFVPWTCSQTDLLATDWELDT